MLTAAANGANGAPPRAVMLSISAISSRDGVSKPTVSNHVKRLVERHGLTVERDGQGRVAAVNVAEYDHLRAAVGDPSKTQAPHSAGPRLDRPQAESYDEAIRQKTWHEAEKRGIELRELRGELVRRDKVTEAAIRVATDVIGILDRIPGAADDLATAVAREGTHGLRVALKRLANSLRADLAKALTAIAADAPEFDGAEEPETDGTVSGLVET